MHCPACGTAPAPGSTGADACAQCGAALTPWQTAVDLPPVEDHHTEPPTVPGKLPTLAAKPPPAGAPAATVLSLEPVPGRASATEHALEPVPAAGKTVLGLEPVTSPASHPPRVADRETLDDPFRAAARRGAPETTEPPTRPGSERRHPSSSARLRAARALEASPAAQVEPGTMLGGLQLVNRIGAGGMGTVWLARQLSLDRNVAVKVLRPEFSQDPHFVLAFTREALAAAQLVHHNIAQIYDSGTDQGLHYFSMEYVDGESLSAMVKREGRLTPEVAAGYVLQAARGLKFAHDRGMIHRDIKPENLLLNTDGIVKVADLGLVKRTEVKKAQADSALPGALELSDIIMEGTAMGTPAFMAPEQARDSRGVDQRADVYSLGCTLYNLVTGRPPFRGDSPLQVMSQHFFKKPTPPEELAHRVPRSLSDIILTMMAKKPEDRFQDMDEVITALEGFLGIDGTVAFSPREEHAALLERSVAAFNGAPWARRRGYAAASFVGLTLGFVFDASYLGAYGAAAFAAAFAAAAVLTSIAIHSVVGRGPLLLRVRHLVLGAGLWTWVGTVGVLAVVVAALAWAGSLRSVAEVLGLGVAVALAFYLLVDRRAARQRPAVDAVEQMLKGMRLRGLEELKLRQFVCKFAGDDWEPCYERLFGYEAKLFARQRWGRDDRNQPRRKRGVWLDPVIRGLDGLLARRQQRRNARQLEKLAAEDQRHEAPPAPPPPPPL